MRALIIVDVQNDFLPGGSLAVPNGNEVIDVINELQAQYSLVVATQDWHPRRHQSFASAHPRKKPFEQITLHGLKQVLWPDHCVQESHGAAFTAELKMAAVEAIFRKGMDVTIDSYSGFFDNGRKKATGMVDFLKGRGVTEVDVCGLAADYCVYFTANDALDLGFKARMLDFATRPIDLANYEAIKIAFAAKGGEVLTD
ncbi:bifunctional nicotinamidase/pyrazinamidase [Olivibacter sp. SDN3]|uniref:bifunctional nicotinamidase/pyrazinamidase n=1 Tax=Olivibacter sp. SDN3 TaxID=2764720 RepID=UPI001651AA3B|nr:bifunctional nicotinamidase/pyrazinamidase [Olivibacter sp. SDN3]QNL50640.1 bifunctional nicotinamidase/pyrazinamidase [Olivibacter sp. SDN3]